MIGYLLDVEVRELIGGLFLLLGAIIILTTIWKVLKGSLLKLIGIFFVIALSLYSNNGANYFLAILVVATLVTDLTFLQNIAAIIRNSNSYFGYLEKQTSSDIHENIRTEVIEIENSDESIEDNEEFVPIEGNDISFRIDKENLRPEHFHMYVERKMLEHLKANFSYPIKEYIRIMSGGNRIDFDCAVLTSTDELYIDIKTSTKNFIPKVYIRKMLLRSIEVLSSRVTNKRIEYRIIIVGDYDEKSSGKLLDELRQVNETAPFLCTIDFFSFKEIGVDINEFSSMHGRGQ